ncbi:MAG: hypothetical protein GDA51_07835 [Ekhidna sp.]|nr:hypothetical protein [Ekhidna sp.]MBC6426362.1 hypothetical protein [Ekhidna sp.]
MRANWGLLLVFCFACDRDFFPKDLYDYQVERLLSGGDTKVWNQIIASENCQDSVKLVFSLLSGSPNDSVSVSRLLSNAACDGFDTTRLGNADASSFEDALTFTDSLNFSTGDFWIIQSITSTELSIIQSGQSVFFN